MKYALTLFIVYLFSSCKGDVTANLAKEEAPAFSIDSVRSVIEQKDKEWADAVVSGDSVAMVNHFTKNGKILAPNSEAIVGREAIGVLVSGVMKAGIKEYKDEITDLYGTENNLVEEGIYTMGDGKGKILDKGHYIAIWTKEDGDWKIRTDMFHSSLPAPSPQNK